MGTFFSEELKLAASKGYHIEPIAGYIGGWVMKACCERFIVKGQMIGGGVLRLEILQPYINQSPYNPQQSCELSRRSSWLIN